MPSFQVQDDNEGGHIDIFVKLTWNGECVLDSLKNAGGFKAIEEVLNFTPSAFGITIDLKKLIKAILS